MGIRGEIYTTRASSGNRTYFFNVKENRNGDLFLNVVESKKHGDTGFERHQIVVFEEDLVEFLDEFNKAVEFMKGRTKNPDRGSFRSGDRRRHGDGESSREYRSGESRRSAYRREEDPHHEDSSKSYGDESGKDRT